MKALPGIWTTDLGDVTFQWQIEADDEWRELADATAQELPLDEALNGETVRCVVTPGAEKS